MIHLHSHLKFLPHDLKHVQDWRGVVLPSTTEITPGTFQYTETEKDWATSLLRLVKIQ